MSDDTIHFGPEPSRPNVCDACKQKTSFITRRDARAWCNECYVREYNPTGCAAFAYEENGCE